MSLSPEFFASAFGLPEGAGAPDPDGHVSYRLGDVGELALNSEHCALIAAERASHEVEERAFLHFGMSQDAAAPIVSCSAGGRLCFHWPARGFGTGGRNEESEAALRGLGEVIAFLGEARR